MRAEPILFAHRGARAHAPENTLDAFALALRLGATGLETDAWMTADGVVVLDHDGLVRRRLRNVALSSLARAELPAHIPALSELVERCGTDYELSIDVKDPSAFEAIADVAAHVGLEPHRVWLCHHDHRLLADRRRDLDGFRLVDSTRLTRIKEGPEMRMLQLREAGIDCINMHHTDWSGGLVTLAHKFGRLAFGWDAQYDDALDAALRMGLDAVYSDHTDRMVDAARRL